MTSFGTRFSVAERPELSCEVHVESCRGASEAAVRERGLAVTAFWHVGNQSPLALLTMATGGAAGRLAVVRAVEGEGGAALSRLHAECLQDNKTAVAQPLAAGRELHLVALPGAPCFWCVPSVSTGIAVCAAPLPRTPALAPAHAPRTHARALARQIRVFSPRTASVWALLRGAGCAYLVARFQGL